MKQLVAIHRICVCRCCTDRSYFAKLLCGGGAGERAKIWSCSAFLAVFGPLGQFWTNLAKLAILGNFWDFPNFGQILRDFEANLALWQNLDLFCHVGHFWQFWWILGKFGGFGKFRHFRHFLPFLANLGNFGNFRQIWQFWRFSQFWLNFKGILKVNLALWP